MKTTTGLPVTCPDCDATMTARDAADIDRVVAAHDRVCPGRKPKARGSVGDITCPDCGKVLASNVGGTGDVAKRTELLMAQHTCKAKPREVIDRRLSAPPKAPAVPVVAEKPRLEDPPPAASSFGRNVHPDLVAARDLAMANPGRWVRVPGDWSKGSRGRIVGKAQLAAFRDTGLWEAAERAITGSRPARCRLWIRLAVEG